jgi:uncharacterized protein with PIN domain
MALGRLAAWVRLGGIHPLCPSDVDDQQMLAMTKAVDQPRDTMEALIA